MGHNSYFKKNSIYLILLIAKVMFDITYDTKNSIKKYVQMFEKKSKEKKEKIIADINLSQLVARIFCRNVFF